jgi:dsDNA-specific endonuclease/ATPase MutS2
VKPGDRVKISDEKGVYTVIRKISSKEILVSTEDGLELPLPAERLIVILDKAEEFYINTSDRKKETAVKQVNKKPKRSQLTKYKEVDLHIKGSSVTSSGMNKIDIQLLRFRAELDRAIMENKQEIIFIHGVGSGRLRTMIRKILSEIYVNCTVQDASFSRYGVNGATHIIIKGNRK